MNKTSSHSDFRTTRRTLPLLLVVVAALALLATSCGGSTSGTGGSSDKPTVVVTTSILGDVVSNLLGDAADVETVMPAGVDPHEFQASAQQVNAMQTADVLVVNGAGFEEGLHDTIEAAEADGVATCTAIDSVETLELTDGDHGHAHESDGTAATDDTHADGEDHEHEGVDPHFFTDPARMVAAAKGLTDCIIAAAPALDTPAVRSSADAYIAELEKLDSDVEAILAAVPADKRILVTNHDVFGYFADRYGFEVAGAILPVSTQSEADAAALTELAELIEAEGVPAVFADTSSPDQLAQALAAEVGSDVEVVELFSESLGPDGGETYVAMMTTNAQRIAAALG